MAKCIPAITVQYCTTVYIAGVVSIRFKLTEDGRVHLVATGNGIETGHGAGVGNGEMETCVSGDRTEGDTQSLTHPIVRLDFIKATAGFNGLKHEEIVKASSELKKNVQKSCRGDLEVERFISLKPTELSCYHCVY